MKIKQTKEFFSYYSIDELLELDGLGNTKEEHLLFGHGENVTYFDSLKEYKSEKEEFEQWVKGSNYRVKQVFKTINERLAFVLVKDELVDDYDNWIVIDSHSELECSLQRAEIEGDTYYRVEQHGMVTDYSDYKLAMQDYKNKILNLN